MDLKLLEKKYYHYPEKGSFLPLANLYRQENKLAECIEILREGLAKIPEYWAARVALGRALFEKGEVDAALEELEAASIHVPENYLVHQLLASIYMKKGDLTKATSYCQLVLFTNPCHPECLQIMKEATKNTEQGKPILSNTLPGKLIPGIETLPPESPKPLRQAKLPLPQIETQTPTEMEEEEILTATLAELYIAQDLPEKAIEIYEKLMALQPEHQEEWKKRIVGLCQDKNEKYNEKYNEPPAQAPDDNKTLRQLELWLENIEKYEKIRNF